MTEVWTRMHPELRVALERMAAETPADLRERSVVDQRAWGAERSEIYTGSETDTGVSWSERVVAGPLAAPDLTVRVYEPSASAREPRPAVLYLHGGGMTGGDIASEHPLAARFCAMVDAVVVTVEYRLAPENPYPAAVDDCVAAWGWLAAEAAALGVDPARIAIYGASAGGGLAIATALRVRDEGGPAPCLLVAVQPMIDDRHETDSSREFHSLGPVFYDRQANEASWRHYLGGQEADGYAAPARARDVGGLPPTFIDVGDLDLFRDEDLAFAQRLAVAGVPVELHVYPGAVHSFENLAPGIPISRLAIENRMRAFARAFGREAG